MDESTIHIRRRNLPHWTIDGSTYFITFRMASGTLTVEERRMLIEHLKSGHQKFYQLAAAVVMPDHVHLLLHPLAPYDLPRIMKGIKGVSARKINNQRYSVGTIWQDESFDRILRDEEEFIQKLQYMADNPIKAGLVSTIEEYDSWYMDPEFLSNCASSTDRNVCATDVARSICLTGMEAVQPRLVRQFEQHPFPLLFVTISGAHLYGFPSPDSDYDLRGVHVLPLKEVVGLKTGQETVEKSGIRDGLEIDLVTHDAYKFFGLLLKKNGYVLEQVLSPLVVHTTPEHAELKEIARNCITRHHAHHYLGFAETQWKLFQKDDPPHVKPLLYVYRVLLTGIHLMRTGEVEANLGRLNESFRLPFMPELIERKVAGTEKARLEQADVGFHQREYDRLRADLEQAYQESKLPEAPNGAAALHELLVRIRLGKKLNEVH